MADAPGARRPSAARVRAGGVLLGAGLAAACMSGRVLRGYPGYPFASFSVPGPPDSAFVDLQDALEEEGYAIDYTDRTSGLINTQTGPFRPRDLFLSLVLATAPGRDGWTMVWVAGYEDASAGARRVNPLDDVLWNELMEISARLSARFDGTPPVGPDERGGGGEPGG